MTVIKVIIRRLQGGAPGAPNFLQCIVRFLRVRTDRGPEQLAGILQGRSKGRPRANRVRPCNANATYLQCISNRMKCTDANVVSGFCRRQKFRAEMPEEHSEAAFSRQINQKTPRDY